MAKQKDRIEMGPMKIVSSVVLFLAIAYVVQIADGSDTKISDSMCPDYELTNGSVSVENLGEDQMNNTYHATIRLTCNEGYVFPSDHGQLYNTSITAVCQNNGTWTTMMRCEVVLCPSVHLGFQPASWHLTDGIAGTYSYRSIATMTCNQGYYVEGPSDIHCGGDGNWHPWGWGRCVAKRCNKLLQPEFGKLFITPGIHDISQDNQDTVTYNTAVTIECNPGYILNGDGMVVCLDSWNGTLGNCSAIVCPLPELDHQRGIYTCSHGIDRTCSYNSRLSIKCHEGYQLKGPNSSNCTETGLWNGTIGTCEAIYCGWPTNVPHNRTLVFVPGIDNGTSYNATIHLLCSEHRKYSSMGLVILQCTSEGVWKGSLGQCENEQNINPEADAATERLLLIPIAVLTPLCLVLIVSVIVVCYRLHRFAHIVNESHDQDARNETGSYDELKVDTTIKVEYDELEFTTGTA